MLELRTYSRQELIELFNNKRLDYIKRKIERAGYKYVDDGRASAYTMTITEIPKGAKFKEYCINELGFPARTDFNKLKIFIYNFIYDEEFITLQFKQMKEKLEQQGISIDQTTVSNYFHRLESNGLAYKGNQEFVYYVYDKRQRKSIRIEKDEYMEMYKSFWEQAEKDNWDFRNAEKLIRSKYGGKPYKKPLYEKNGIYNEIYVKLQELLEDEK